MITKEQKEQLTQLIANMDAERHYWFFRTMSGYYFDEFLKNGFIAIGYDEILMKELRALPKRDDEARAQLKIHLNSQGHDLSPSQTAKAAGQILKFYREMRQGDVVIIPSFQSQEFAFGVVQGDLYEDVKEHHAEGECTFAKRRSIKWLKMVNRKELDPKFLLGLCNQQTMSCVDAYAEFIDRKMQKLYSKGDKTYLVLRVNQDKGLTWDDFCVLSDMAKLMEDVTHRLGESLDISQFEMKINVQSPGDILLECANNSKYLLALLGMIITVMLKGGELDARIFKFKSSSIGNVIKEIVEAINSYKNAKTERKFKEVQIRLLNMKLDQIKSLDDLSQIESSEIFQFLSSLPQSEDGSAQKEPPRQ